jgi:hypothetical protein
MTTYPHRQVGDEGDCCDGSGGGNGRPALTRSAGCALSLHA